MHGLWKIMRGIMLLTEVRAFLIYMSIYMMIQLAQHPQAPEIDVERVIFKKDYRKKERIHDTLEKIKYIPEPEKL